MAPNLPSILERRAAGKPVELRLQQAYPTAEIIIHIDPVSVVAGEPTPEYPPANKP